MLKSYNFISSCLLIKKSFPGSLQKSPISFIVISLVEIPILVKLLISSCSMTLMETLVLQSSGLLLFSNSSFQYSLIWIVYRISSGFISISELPVTSINRIISSFLFCAVIVVSKNIQDSIKKNFFMVESVFYLLQDIFFVRENNRISIIL